jgi:hypothetical protein
MASRLPPASQERYSPPTDAHDPFNQRYYDEPESNDPYRPRDTYASASSYDEHEQERFYGGEDPYSVYPTGLFVHHTLAHTRTTAHPDTDSDRDVYPQPYQPESSESLPGPKMGVYPDHSSAPFADFAGAQFGGGREPYPAWSADRQIPLSKEEIEDIFLDLQQKFGFQRDSMRNMVSTVFRSSFLSPLLPLGYPSLSTYETTTYSISSPVPPAWLKACNRLSRNAVAWGVVYSSALVPCRLISRPFGNRVARTVHVQRISRSRHQALVSL